jgi:serine protease Do
MRKRKFIPTKLFEVLRTLTILLTMILPAASFCRAEVVKLKGGAMLKGAVLKKAPTFIILDLGYDVVRIPRSEILDIKKNAAFDIPTRHATAKESPRGSSLYTAKRMPEISTVNGVSTFAPAVVMVRSPLGVGSGFFVNDDGHLITNFHVIRGQKHITVIRYQKTESQIIRITHKKVRIIALDPFHDLAVLKIREPLDDSFRPTVLCAGERTVVGEKIFVIGSPLGLERTVTEGVISHTARNFGGRIYLQVDASVNPGNSGGPLFNRRGQVIGVINMGIASMQGLNFAIPVENVKYVLDHLDAFAYDESNPQSGYVYLPPPPNPNKKKNNTEKKQ